MQDSGFQYNAALYIRLSREDENNDDSESQSIGNQRDFLVAYCQERSIRVYRIYVDDGYSGTDFERPAFKQMIQAIEAGFVNLVVTKDMSRLGRETSDTLFYIEKYFPGRNVRYVAVNDGVDTFSPQGNEFNAFRAVFNDMYAGDISKKVITSLRTKAGKGEFIGSVAPYGYKKHPDNKNKLTPNEETSRIVGQIFDWYLAGMGYVAIAKKLTGMGVPTPSAYNRMQYGIRNHNASGEGQYRWSIDIIGRILKNPVYAGHMVQHKTSVINYKVHKKRPVPLEQQILVRHTHEPLVDQATFDKVQEMLQKKSNYYRPGNALKPGHLMAGTLYCGLCGSRMTFSKTTKGSRKGEFYAICARYKRYSQCKRNVIYEKDIESLTAYSLRSLVSFVDMEDILSRIEIKSGGNGLYELELEKQRLSDKLTETAQALKKLYSDRVKGVVDEELFVALSRDFQKDKETISEQIAHVNEEIRRVGHLNHEDNFRAYMEKLFGMAPLTKDILLHLVNKIEIHDNKTVRIYWKFGKDTN